MKKIIFTMITGLLILASCTSTKQAKVAGNYRFNTECLGVEGDGSQTLKAWGSGRNMVDAYEQARKNAVSDVVFKGITVGKAECDVRALVPEVNARQKYEAYFNSFFADGGEYKKYVSMADEQFENKLTRERKEGTGTVTHSAVVRVKRAELKEKLKADGILK